MTQDNSERDSDKQRDKETEKRHNGQERGKNLRQKRSGSYNINGPCSVHRSKNKMAFVPVAVNAGAPSADNELSIPQHESWKTQRTHNRNGQQAHKCDDTISLTLTCGSAFSRRNATGAGI